MKSSKSRSAKLAGVLFALGLATAAEARMPAVPRIAVEIASATASGAAVDIRRQLPAAIAAELAANPGAVPPGARIIVRITTIFLSSDVGGSGGSGGRRGGGSSMDDGIDGEILLVDPRGRVLMQKPMQSRSPVSAGGSVWTPDYEQKRVKELVNRFAYWTVRALN